MSHVTLDPNREISIEQVMTVVRGKAEVRLSESSSWREQLKRSRRALEEKLNDTGEVYGVTTGVGDTCYREISSEHVDDFSLQLMRGHGCGMGDTLSESQATAVLMTRLISLIQPSSGIRIKLVEQLRDLINHRVIPVIPEEGSVGASGDLNPLSYVAAVLSGERNVFYNGETRAAQDVLADLNMEPLKLGPKEALSVMNGTSVMSGLACIAFDRSRYLMKLSSMLTAMSVLALHGNPAHYDRRIFEWKPHEGTTKIAGWIRTALDLDPEPNASRRKTTENQRLQDRYSLRCAPHVIGVLADALPWIRDQLETEINSSNDNPLIDPETKEVLHGGNFYGGHVAFQMDSLKNPIANLADLLDRQFSQMIDPKLNRGLPANLSGAKGERSVVNHGLKALQISPSSWAAEALKQTGPASVFSRTTESQNQDKVSMGTISSREALRVLELTEQTAAALLIGCTQAIDLRIRMDEISASDVPSAVRTTMDEVRETSSFLSEDRALEPELRTLVKRIRNQQFTLF